MCTDWAINKYVSVASQLIIQNLNREISILYWPMLVLHKSRVHHKHRIKCEGCALELSNKGSVIFITIVKNFRHLACEGAVDSVIRFLFYSRYTEYIEIIHEVTSFLPFPSHLTTLFAPLSHFIK